MDYGMNEQDKWNRKSFGMCKHAFLLEAYIKYLSNEVKDRASFEDFITFAENQAEQLASRSMRIVDESLYKGQPQQPFRNDVIKAKVENKTNNVPFN